jgi:hypothetical protein
MQNSQLARSLTPSKAQIGPIPTNGAPLFAAIGGSSNVYGKLFDNAVYEVIRVWRIRLQSKSKGVDPK